MKQIRRRTVLLAAAALCWGIMFPEYVFTPDSYTALVYEASDPLCGQGADGAAGILTPDCAHAAEYIQNAENSQDAEDIQNAVDIQELCEAVREGRVRYRIGFIEYLRNYLFGT